MANIDEISFSNAVLNGTTSGNTELAVCQVSGITPARFNCNVMLWAYLGFTTSTNITSARLRLRQGAGITGTVVGDTGVDVSGISASQINTKSLMGVDATPGDVANASYTLTLTTAGGTPGNSTIQFAVMYALISR